MTLNERIAKLRAKRMGQESIAGLGNGTPAPIVREPSINERNAIWRRRGYYLFNCIHDRSKFWPCAQCGRTKREADQNYDEFARGLE